MRAFAALLLALGIGAAAMSWQTFGYAAKKALVSWAPKWAIAASLPLDKLGLGSNSTPSDDPAEATPAQPAATAQSASDGSASENAAAAAVVPSDAAQQLQSMARDLANANQEVETLKGTIAELKAGQQQMARDLAKVTDKLAEQNAKAKLAATTPHPPAPAAHRPAPVYSSTGYAPAATPAPPPPAYRPASSSYSAQASAVPPPPSAAAQPYPPAPQIQPQADPGVVGSAPRPPMPLTPQ
jgi:TolA-binding protein